MSVSANERAIRIPRPKVSLYLEPEHNERSDRCLATYRRLNNANLVLML